MNNVIEKGKKICLLCFCCKNVNLNHASLVWFSDKTSVDRTYNDKTYIVASSNSPVNTSGIRQCVYKEMREYLVRNISVYPRHSSRSLAYTGDPAWTWPITIIRVRRSRRLRPRRRRWWQPFPLLARRATPTSSFQGSGRRIRACGLPRLSVFWRIETWRASSTATA